MTYTDYTNRYEIPPTFACNGCRHCLYAFVGLADIVVRCDFTPVNPVRKSLVVPFEHCSFRME